MPGDVFTSHQALAAQHRWTADECTGTLRIYDRDDHYAYAACDANGCSLDVAVPLRELDQSILTAHLLTQAELPPRFVERQYEPNSESAHVVSLLDEWAGREELSPAPVLWGKPGRGKTLLMVRALRSLIRGRQVRAWFVTAPDLLSRMQAAMGTGEYDELWRRACSVDVLLLDDLGAEMDTDWRADRISALVDDRYRGDLPLMATTNIAPARWSEAFDARTASRLHEMALPYELVGVDHRMTKEDR